VNRTALLQTARFGAVGALNTLIDLGVLNILIGCTGIARGWPFSIFKAVSFTAAVVNSYFLNKIWTFRKNEWREPKREFARFCAISVVGLVLNVGMASLTVGVIGPHVHLSPRLWASAAAVIAGAACMAWNFVGYKFWVFNA
jgi:putative flippase GtrA